MTATLDLFGVPITERQAPAPVVNGVRKRGPTKLRGYAAPPGSGPAGETCRTCAFYSGVRHAKTYRKCLLMRPQWTGGPGTDILARSPACTHWRKEATDCPACQGRGYRLDLPKGPGRFDGHPACTDCNTRGVVFPSENTEVRHARAAADAAPSVEGPNKSRPGPER